MPLVVIRDLLPELFDKTWPFGPRPHETHIASDDIDELGEFIQAVLPKKAAYSGDAWIVLGRPLRAVRRFGIQPHRAEFHQIEAPVPVSDPSLMVEHRAFGIQPNC